MPPEPSPNGSTALHDPAATDHGEVCWVCRLDSIESRLTELAGHLERVENRVMRGHAILSKVEPFIERAKRYLP